MSYLHDRENEFRRRFYEEYSNSTTSLSWESLLAFHRESIVGLKRLIEEESTKDEHKKDTQTCPTHVLDERVAYNAGLKKGFNIVLALLSDIKS